MGSKADYLENKVLDHVLRNTTYTQAATVYSALFTVAPSDSTAGTEVTNASSGYTRVATTFSTAASGSITNSGAVTFATAAAGYTIIGWGILDTSTVAAGNLLYYTTITTLAIAINDQANIAAGGIIITED